MVSADEMESFLTKLFVGFVLFCLALMGLGWCAETIAKPVLYPVGQAGVVAERTLNADNVIYNYEWFHQYYMEWNGNYFISDRPMRLSQEPMMVMQVNGQGNPVTPSTTTAPAGGTH